MNLFSSTARSAVRRRGVFLETRLVPTFSDPPTHAFTAQPQVLDSQGSTYKSDVYSFGIVVWEVLSRKLPWSDKARPREILSAVLMGIRPSFPTDAPADIADIARACWGGKPDERPTFSAVLESMETKGWAE